MASETSSRSTEDWEIYLGQQFRTMRIRIPLEQTAAALRANVSVGALKNLEWGKGSSLSTIIKVARAYGRTDWLEGLSPTITVSPMQMLKSQRRTALPSRVVRSRKKKA